MFTIWLVVSTPLKNISQLGWLFPIYGKQKKTNHQPAILVGFYVLSFWGLTVWISIREMLCKKIRVLGD